MLALRYVGPGGGERERGKKKGGYAPYTIVSGGHTDGHAHADDGCDCVVHCLRRLTPE